MGTLSYDFIHVHWYSCNPPVQPKVWQRWRFGQLPSWSLLFFSVLIDTEISFPLEQESLVLPSFFPQAHSITSVNLPAYCCSCSSWWADNWAFWHSYSQKTPFFWAFVICHSLSLKERKKKNHCFKICNEARDSSQATPLQSHLYMR